MNKDKRRKYVKWVFLATVLMMLPLLAVEGRAAGGLDAAAEFYANNTVTVVCPYRAGGGTDYTARMIASYWSSITGGTIKVKNITGGGGLVGTNAVWNAKPDGLMIGVTVGRASLIGPALKGQSGLEFDILKFNYIGSFARDETVFAIGKGVPYKTLKELQTLGKVKLGAADRYGATAMSSALILDWLGLENGRLIVGYEGTSDLALAAGRGEIDAVAQSASSFKRTVRQGYFKPPILTIDFQRSAYWPDTPTITELIQLSEEQKQLLGIVSALKHTKVVFTTPGIPKERVEFLRRTFDKIIANKAFLRQIKLMYPIWTEPVGGLQLAREMQEIMKISKKNVSSINQVIDKYIK